MKVLFYPGALLVLLAFFTVAATVVSRIGGADVGLFDSTETLWRSLDTQGYFEMRRNVSAELGRDIWDGILQPLLNVPGWLLFGIPGFPLVWFFHPMRGETDDEDISDMNLYDELANAAEESESHNDDTAPDHDIAYYAEVDEAPLDSALVEEVDAQLENYRLAARQRMAEVESGEEQPARPENGEVDSALIAEIDAQLENYRLAARQRMAAADED